MSETLQGRLRIQARLFRGGTRDLLREAADEIDRLQAHIASTPSEQAASIEGK